MAIMNHYLNYLEGDFDMAFFNEQQLEAFRTGRYICSKCGATMKFTDEWEDTLICPVCGHDIPGDRYGCESDEEYEAQYPTEEEVCGYVEKDDEENCGETYDEVYGELSDD